MGDGMSGNARPSLIAGAAAVDITPRDSQFLFGYPFVERSSTGVHDRLLSPAMFLSDGRTPLMVVANDAVFLGRDMVHRARSRIERATGVPAANMLISATHTHSGPLTVDTLSSDADPIVPKADPRYARLLEDGIVRAASTAYCNSRPATIGLVVAGAAGVGTNRRDPAGPADAEVPVLAVRDGECGALLAVMLVCSMHPTVLHEDSTLVSGDFPAMTRQYLQEHVLGTDCPVLYHTGPSGNQSPRHVTRSNTFDEALRLGNLLGNSVAQSLDAMDITNHAALGCDRRLIDLPVRAFPPVNHAQQQANRAAERLESLRRSGADRGQVRTAECDWFGAKMALKLAERAADGSLRNAVTAVMPAEIVLMRIGPWAFIGWPGEIFVEFALKVKSLRSNCYIVSQVNSQLEGYLVTEEAARQGCYEALNALFASPESGDMLVKTTLELLAK
jgi:neutral ceramidase